MPSQQGIERARALLRGEPPEDEGFLGGVRRRAEGLLSAGEVVGEYGVHGVRELLGGAERGARFLEERGEAVRGSLRGADLPGEFGPGVPGAVPGALQAASGALPAVRPEVAQSIPGRVIGAVGQIAPGLATGMRGAAIYGLIQEAQGRYEEVLQRLGRSRDAYQKANVALLVGAVLGLADALPAGKVLGKLDKATGGYSGRLLRMYARLPTAVGGGLTEGGQSILGDLAVEHLTDQDIDVLRNAAQEALYGGAAFGILGAFAKAFGRQRAGQEAGGAPEGEVATETQEISEAPREGFLGPEGPAQELQAGRVGPRGEFIPSPAPPSEPISSEVSDLSAGRPKPAASEPKRKDRGFLQDLRSEPRELAEPETEEHRRFARLIEEASNPEFVRAVQEMSPEESLRLIDYMARGYLRKGEEGQADVEEEIARGGEASKQDIIERIARGDEVAQREAELAQSDLPLEIPDVETDLTVVRQIEREGRIYTHYTRPGQRPIVTERERAEAAARAQEEARAEPPFRSAEEMDLFRRLEATNLRTSPIIAERTLFSEDERIRARVKAVDQWREALGRPEAQSIAAQVERARRALETDRRGEERRIRSKLASGDILAPWEMKAASRLVQDGILHGRSAAEYADSVMLADALRDNRAETARALGVERDPLKTQRERFEEALSTPGPETRFRLEADKRILRKLEERLTSAERHRRRAYEIETEIKRAIDDLGRSFGASAFSGVPLDPELLGRVARIAGLYIQKGYHSFAAFSADLTQTLGSRVAPYLERAWRQAGGAIEERGGRRLSGLEARAAKIRKRIQRTLEREGKRLEKAKRRLAALGLPLDALSDAQLNDPDVQATIATVLSTAKATGRDMYLEYVLSGLFSAPTTHKANIYGNFTNIALNQHVQRLSESLVNLVVRDRSSPTFREAIPFYRNFLHNLAQAGRNFLLAYKREVPVYEVDLARRGVELSDVGVRIDALHGPAIPGKLGKIVRAPGFTTLLAVDEFFKTLSGTMELQGLAYRAARAEGLRGEALGRRMEEIVNDPSHPVQEEAHEKAVELAFQDKTDKIPRLALQLRRWIDNKIPWYPLGSTLVPTVSTPYNIFKAGFRLAFGTVIAPAKTIAGKHRGDPRAVVEDYGRAVVSAGITMGILSLVFDDDEDGKPRITGTRPYKRVAAAEVPQTSIRIGEQYYNYGRIEPFAVTVSTIIDMAEAVKRGLQTGRETEALGELIASVFRQTENKTFLRSFGDVMDIVREDGRRGSIAPRMVMDRLGTFHVPNYVRSTVRQLDPYVRDRAVRKQEDGILSMWEQGAKAIPYDLFPYGQMLRRYDYWGQPLRRFPEGQSPASHMLDQLVNPFPRDYRNYHQLDRLRLRWNYKVDAGLSAPGQPRFDPAPPNYYYRFKPYESAAYEMLYWDPREYESLVRDAGRLATRRLLDRRLNYQDPTHEDIKAVKDEMEDARAKVRNRLMEARGYTRTGNQWRRRAEER